MQITITERYTDEEVKQVLELYDYMKGMQLTTGQAIRLLDTLREAIMDARHAEANKIVL